MKIKNLFMLTLILMFASSSVNAQLEWKPFEGELPENAVIGGVETNRSLAICRCDYKGSMHPGKVVEKACNIGWGGKEIKVNNFEVLVNNGVVELDWVKTKGKLPENAIKAGTENGVDLYIGRKFYENGTHPGKVFQIRKKYICNVGWGGKEMTFKVFEVLVEHKTTPRASRVAHDSRCEVSKAQPVHNVGKYIAKMSKGSQINEGFSVVSQNLRFQTRVTGDGRLVVEEILDIALCDDGKILVFKTNEIWANTMEGNDAKLDYYLKFQDDGNLCIYSEQAGFVWCSMSNGPNSHHLEISNIGHLEIVNDHGGEVWPD
jgi:hypothetical protein